MESNAPIPAASDKYQARLRRLRASMIDEHVCAVVLTPGSNMKYLCGYSEEGHERLICLVVPSDRDSVLIVPGVNRQSAANNAAGIADIRAWSDAEGWENAVSAFIYALPRSLEYIAFDDDMPARFFLPAAEASAEVSHPVMLAGGMMTQQRVVKDDDEIACIRAASQLTEDALRAGLALCRAGASEREVAAAIDSAFRKAGAAPSFETIVAAGPNSAMPHHMPGDRILADGDIVLFDLGAILGDYRGDITRVYSVGTASDEAARVYEIVYRAQAAGVAAVQHYAAREAIDAAARGVIAEAGYGEQFIHRTGHGLGLDAHEEPNIVAGDGDSVMPGNCFSIEPGIYLPGKFGIRLENIVVVGEDGTAISMNSPIPNTLLSAEAALS